jgi:hypothetical protein
MDNRDRCDRSRAEALKDWKDSRVVDAEWVDAQIWFWQHLYADLVEIGGDLVGVSFSARYREWLMVLKVLVDDVRLVGFVTSKNPTRCMQKARDLLRDNQMKWYRDKYQ